jgi:hypothetical protein
VRSKKDSEHFFQERDKPCWVAYYRNQKVDIQVEHLALCIPDALYVTGSLASKNCGEDLLGNNAKDENGTL